MESDAERTPRQYSRVSEQQHGNATLKNRGLAVSPCGNGSGPMAADWHSANAALAPDRTWWMHTLLIGASVGGCVSFALARWS